MYNSLTFLLKILILHSLKENKILGLSIFQNKVFRIMKLWISLKVFRTFEVLWHLAQLYFGNEYRQYFSFYRSCQLGATAARLA